MTLPLVLLSATAALYLASFAFHLLSFSGVMESGHRPAFSLMRIGFLFATFYFVTEGMEHGSFLPVGNFSQALAFFAWSLAFVYLVLLLHIQSESFGLVLTPVLLLMVGISCAAAFRNDSVSSALNPLFMNPYFALHIVAAFFAYASFALSFAAGILYLIQNHELKNKRAGNFYHKLPSLESLEKLIYQPLFWGAPLLLAAFGIGFIWSKSVYGKYLFFDPKTIATLFTVLIYFMILLLHKAFTLRGKRAAVLSLLAFSFVLVSFVGTRFIQGSHNF